MPFNLKVWLPWWWLGVGSGIVRLVDLSTQPMPYVEHRGSLPC